MNKEEKEKALKLSRIWKELAEKGTWFEYLDREDGWRRVTGIPDMQANLSLWRVAEPKKTIDLSIMVGTDVDMEFADWGEDFTSNIKWEIGKLDAISGHSYPYNKLNCGDFKKCRIRQNHIHWYKGFHLPDGLLVTLYYDGIPPKTCPSQDIDWHNTHGVSGFKIIDTLPEYCYEWEKYQNE